METKTYSYKQKLSTALGGLLISGALTYGGVHSAMTNDRGLIINQIIRLSPTAATVFYALMALVFALMLVTCIFLTLMALTTKRVVALYSDRLEAPKGGFSKTNVAIPYTSITKIELFEIRDQRFLYVHHRGGRLTLVPALLENKQLIDDIYQTLLSRTRGPTGHSTGTLRDEAVQRL